jgi:hypothetical protein
MLIVPDKVQFNVLIDSETAKLARLAAIGENMRLADWLDEAIRKRAGLRLADWLDEAIRKRAGRPIKAPPVRSGE